MATIQRPAESANALFWHAPPGPAPVGTGVVVGDKDCVVFTLDGGILGVLPPGAHSMDPQAMPFLAPAVDAGANITAELWFVRTSPLQGCKGGGSLGAMHDGNTGLSATPRVTFEYTLAVTDPVAFVRASMTMSDPEAALAFASQTILAKMTELYTRLAAETHMAMLGPNVVPRISQELAPMLTDLHAQGLAVNVGSFNTSFSSEERDAIVRSNAERAKEQRQLKIAEIDRAGAATAAAGTGGAVPMISAPLVAATPPVGAPQMPARKGKGGLIVAIVLGVIVLGGAVALAMHFVHGESSEKGHAAPHDTKHGKH